jgi:pilus assembly protein Flp/PilA
MHKYTEAIFNFLTREDGPTAVEYAVILSAIIVVCLGAVAFIGSGSSDLFNAAAPPVVGP